MWNLPRSGIEPVSPALTGGLLTTGPPGKSLVALQTLSVNSNHSSALQIERQAQEVEGTAQVHATITKSVWLPSSFFFDSQPQTAALPHTLQLIFLITHHKLNTLHKLI